MGRLRGWRVVGTIEGISSDNHQVSEVEDGSSLGAESWWPQTRYMWVLDQLLIKILIYKFGDLMTAYIPYNTPCSELKSLKLYRFSDNVPCSTVHTVHANIANNIQQKSWSGLTGLFFCSWILYLWSQYGQPVKSTTKKIEFSKIKHRRPQIVLPTVLIKKSFSANRSTHIIFQIIWTVSLNESIICHVKLKFVILNL